LPSRGSTTESIPFTATALMPATSAILFSSTPCDGS
jgi:hypothetical protein